MPDLPDSGFAFWTDPDSSLTITYSLAVFHEIDFLVNENFRRIPHGGMETGGLLFGHARGNGIIIEAFRPIECEHAFGPSFVLSDRDLKALEHQLAAASSDPDLAGLEPLGWFIAHTRSDLILNEREIAWFHRFFPGSGKLTVLVKPERFQPTRFAFLVRGPGGHLVSDGRDRAIILPLPGRASGTITQPAPSILAPRAEAKPPFPAAKAHAERMTAEGKSEAAPMQRWPLEQEPAVRSPQAPSPPDPRSQRDADVQPRSKPVPESARDPIPMDRPAIAYPPGAAARELFYTTGYQRKRLEDSDGRLSAPVRLFLALLIVIFGCAAGYWAYLQLPPATIPLNIRPQGSVLLVSWPPDQTRDAASAAIRIDDGPPVPLTEADKLAGQTIIKPNGSDVKVELIVQHWMRQSRGIVRFVSAAVPSEPAT
jgi:hypothetical protein